MGKRGLHVILNDPDAMHVAEALRGDKRAFTRLNEKYRREAEWMIMGFFRSPDLVAGTVNEGFLRAFDRLHFWDIEQGSFHTWLFTLLRRYAIQVLRRRQVEAKRIRGYLRTRRSYTPPGGDIDDPCELHSEHWFNPAVRAAVDRVIQNLDAERRPWLIDLPGRRQLDREKSSLSRARHEIARPLDIHLSGAALRVAVTRELLLTKLCGKHSGGAHL